MARLVACCALAALTHAQTMSALWPRYGSIAGGTYLIIKGVGWTLGGQPGVVTAYIGGKACVRNQVRV
jgi:hypothetical protein